MRSYCDRIAALLQRRRGQLQHIASTVARTLGADWFRLDVFIVREGGGEPRLVVNEVTYPSHGATAEWVPPRSDGAGGVSSLELLVRGYRQRRRQGGATVDGASITRQLLGLTNTSADAFFNRADFSVLDIVPATISRSAQGSCAKCTARLPAMMRCPQHYLACPGCSRGGVRKGGMLPTRQPQRTSWQWADSRMHDNLRYLKYLETPDAQLL